MRRPRWYWVLWGVAIASLLASHALRIVESHAGGFGVGSGGLQGGASGSSAPDFTDGGAIGGCTIIGGTLKCPVIDAGVLNVEGQVGTAGPIVSRVAGPSGITFTDGNATNRVTFGNNQYIMQHASSGRLFSSGGVTTPNIALGAAAGGSLADSSTAPTISNGCTGEAMAWNNGTANFEFDVGTSCTGVSTMVITMPTVGNCWNCSCWNVTGRRNLMQSACSTTTATITNMGTSVATPADWTDGDNIQCACRGG